MRLPSGLASLAFLCASNAAVAADLLPLALGIYVPAARPCKGASNAEIVNYWGGKSSIGVAQAECTIKKLSRKGNVFTIMDECHDIQSGEAIEGGPTVLVIKDSKSFRMGGVSYRYCGSRVEF